MTVRTYTSPQAFKQALEQRLREASANGVDFARRRQLLVFDRFLARIVVVLGDAAILKGGLVLELRLERARTTKDIDLRLTGPPDNVLARLQEAGQLDLGDFMAFEVSRDAEQPKIQNDGMQYEGLRFRAQCRLAGKLYGQVFGVDAAFGDPILGEPEIATADDVLAFAGSRRQLYGFIRSKLISQRNCTPTQCREGGQTLASKTCRISRYLPQRNQLRQCACERPWKRPLYFEQLTRYREHCRIHLPAGPRHMHSWRERIILHGAHWSNSPRSSVHSSIRYCPLTTAEAGTQLTGLGNDDICLYDLSRARSST